MNMNTWLTLCPAAVSELSMNKTPATVPPIHAIRFYILKPVWKLCTLFYIRPGDKAMQSYVWQDLYLDAVLIVKGRETNRVEALRWVCYVIIEWPCQERDKDVWNKHNPQALSWSNALQHDVFAFWTEEEEEAELFVSVCFGCVHFVSAFWGVGCLTVCGFKLSLSQGTVGL